MEHHSLHSASLLTSGTARLGARRRRVLRGILTAGSGSTPVSETRARLRAMADLLPRESFEKTPARNLNLVSIAKNRLLFSSRVSDMELASARTCSLRVRVP